MSETLVTVVGNVATAPVRKETSTGATVVRFRLATTERRWDRAGDRWADGYTSFYTVWAFRTLGENVAASLGLGEPVIVQGRLRVMEREEKGQTYVTAAIDATAVGHDLTRGTSAFRRVVRARPELVEPQATVGAVTNAGVNVGINAGRDVRPGVGEKAEPDVAGASGNRGSRFVAM